MTRLIKLFAAACLLSFSTILWAQTVSEVVVRPTHTVDIREFAKSLQWEPVMDSPSRSAVRMGTPAPDDIRWIDRIKNMPAYFVNFYNTYTTKVEEALSGKTNYLVDHKSGTKQNTDFWEDYYFVPLTVWHKRVEYTFPVDVDYTDPNAKREFAMQAVADEVKKMEDEMDTFFPYAMMCMDYDNPQAFWLSNSYVWCGDYSYQWNYLREKGRDYVDIKYNAYFVIKGTVDDKPYDFRIEPFRTASAVKAGITEYKALVDNILEDLPNSTRYVQLRYLNKWLTEHNSYASNYDPQTSPALVWSPISALRGTTGDSAPVCEGYARALKVLLDKINIPCMLAIGDAKYNPYVTPESHMWNEVKMNDGQWYGVDVTWNDPITGALNELAKSGAENEDWLLLGKNDVVEGLTFAQSHPNGLTYNQDKAVKWDYDISSLIADTGFDVSTYGVPQVAASASAVKVYSIVGVDLGTFESMDQAISSLESGLYIINGRKVVVK